MHTISDVMTKNVEVLNPNADLIEVAQNMRRQDVGILPVSDGRKVQGIVTKSDVVIGALAKNRDPRRTRASEVMTRSIDYCYEDQSIEEAQEIMQKNDVNHLLVLDRDKNLVGIVSLEDLHHWRGRGLTRSLFGEAFRPNVGLSSQWRNMRFTPGMIAGVSSIAALFAGLWFFGRRMEPSQYGRSSRRPGERETRAA